MDCMRNNFTAGVLLNGRFRTVSPLNHGSFGMVFKARDQFTNDFVALKCITKTLPASIPSTIAVDERSEELAIHRRIGGHRNIVGLVGSFETAHHVYLVLEYCANGDLYEAIRLGRGPLQTEHVRQFMLQLIDAVQHMHSKGVFHRDIKPENIFLDSRGAMKLGDFGLATRDAWSQEAAVGSDRYMAPEQYDPTGNGYAPATADVWSVGICLLNVLFSRNPFAVPTPSDPLYRDFVTDRQTLFDVFPTMSQDTFEVLVHCLAIDPANRSFAAAKAALKRVVSFTTDDESLDEFCNDDVSAPMATFNRQPLRTPSIQSPHVDAAGAFPWAKALAMSPPQQIRQLSVVVDTELSEPLFPGSEDDGKDWNSSKPDSASISSFVDSGLGVSVKTSSTGPQRTRYDELDFDRSRPVAIAGSLPASAARPRPVLSLSQVFQAKRDLVSKSWSDLWDEDEEALGLESSDAENADSLGSRFGTRGMMKNTDWGYESSDGRSTPRNRVALSEVKNPASALNIRSLSPRSPQEPDTGVDERISEHTGFMFEEHSTSTAADKNGAPWKHSILDKWAKLGARRRNERLPTSGTTSGSVTPKASKVLPVVSVAKREVAGTGATAAAVEPRTLPSVPRKRSQTRVGSWRGRGRDAWTQHSNRSETWVLTDRRETGARAKSTNGGNGKEWLRSHDWRQHSPTLPRDMGQRQAQHAVVGDDNNNNNNKKLGTSAGGEIERVWRHELHL